MTRYSNQGIPGQGGQSETAAEVDGLVILRTLRQSWLLLVGVPVLAAVLAFGIASLLRPTFTATARILSPQQQGSTASLVTALSGLTGGGGGALASLRNPVDQWVSLFRSRTVGDALVERFNLRERYELELLSDARTRLAAATRVGGGRDNLITIEVDDHDPKIAADMANAYVEELQRLSKTLAVTEAAQRRVFFEQQLAHARDSLTKAEVALKQSGINSNVVKTNPEAAVRELGLLKAQVAAAEVRVTSLRTVMTDNSPEVIQAISQLGSLRSVLARTQAGEAAGGRAEDGQYVERFRNFKYHETLFELMARQFELAKADEARDGAVIQIVDAAVPPERKSKPRRAVIALTAMLLALVGCVGFVLLRRALRGDRLVQPTPAG